MSDLSRGAASAPQPLPLFRAALATAAAQERAARTRRPERAAALQSLTDTDLARLAEHFEALLQGPPEIAALAAQLHDALRALSPEAPATEEASDA